MKDYRIMLEQWRKRREEIYELNLKGKSYTYLAAKYGITYPRVAAIVKQIRKKRNEKAK